MSLLQQMQGMMAQAHSSGSTSTRYWRIHITATDTNQTATSLGELQFRATVGGASLCTGGTASSSSDFDTSHAAAKAFDGTSSTIWSSVVGGVPAWLEYAMATASVVNQVVIAARDDTTSTFGQTPKDFTVQSSTDGGTTWNDEWSVTGQTGWTIGEIRTFNRP